MASADWANIGIFIATAVGIVISVVGASFKFHSDLRNDIISLKAEQTSTNKLHTEIVGSLKDRMARLEDQMNGLVRELIEALKLKHGP